MSRTKDPKRLVAQILKATSPPVASAPTLETAIPDAASGLLPTMQEDAVADLIEVYFTLEEPAERDVAFDTLAAVKTDTTSDFFVAMMVHDEDAFMRRAAAAELARRGHPEALESLQEDLAPSSDPLAFEHALETLAEIEAANFIPVVAAIWKDGSRNSLQRRVAMSIFEVLDAPKALKAFAAFVQSIVDVKNFPDDILEQAMAAFGRHDYGAAAPVLKGLQVRMAQALWEDEAEKQEAIAFVGEGLALLE